MCYFVDVIHHLADETTIKFMILKYFSMNAILCGGFIFTSSENICVRTGLHDHWIEVAYLFFVL